MMFSSYFRCKKKSSMIRTNSNETFVMYLSDDE